MASEWLSIVLATAGMLAATAAAARAALSGAREQDDVEQRWQELAARIRGSLTVGNRTLLSPRRLSLQWTRDEATARVETKVPLDLRAPGHTRATATYVIGSGPIFRLSRRSELDGAGAEVEAFADHPVLRVSTHLTTEMPAAVGRAFGRVVREGIAYFPRQFSLRSDGAELELVWDGTEVDAEVLERSLTIVAELARFGLADLRALAALEGAEYDGEGSDPNGRRRPQVRVRRGPGAVELFAQRAGVIARVTPRRPVPAFRVRIDAKGALAGVIPDGVVAPSELAGLGAVGPAIFSADGDRMEFAWPVAPSLAQAERAVRVLAAWAAGSEGAFR